MSSRGKQDWNNEGLRILIDLNDVPASDRYAFIMARAKSLDPKVRDLAASFALAAYNAGNVDVSKIKQEMHRTDTIATLAKIVCVVGVLFAALGVWGLMGVSGENTIEAWGLKIQTQSASLGGLGLGVLLVLFTVRTAIKSI